MHACLRTEMAKLRKTAIAKGLVYKSDAQAIDCVQVTDEWRTKFPPCQNAGNGIRNIIIIVIVITLFLYSAISISVQWRFTIYNYKIYMHENILKKMKIEIRATWYLQFIF